MAGITPPSVIAITLLVSKKKNINQHEGAYAALAGRYMYAIQDRTNLIRFDFFFSMCYCRFQKFLF